MEQKRNPQSRRPRGADSGERWDEIIHAAAGIFYEKGYEATSLQDIASAVGLLKGSVYYYIETKEDLLYELVTRAQALMMATLVEDPTTASAPAPERLRSFIGRWMALSAREREWATVAEREFNRLSRRRLRVVIVRRDHFSAFVKGIISQGVHDGAFDPSVDLSVATSAVFELMKTTHLWHRPSGPLTLAEIGDWYATFVIRGLGGPRWSESKLGGPGGQSSHGPASSHAGPGTHGAQESHSAQGTHGAEGTHGAQGTHAAQVTQSAQSRNGAPA